MINVNQIESKPRSIEDMLGNEPPVKEGYGTYYPKKINDNVELFYKDSNDNEVQITDKGSVALPTIPALVPVGGAMSSLLCKSSSEDHDTTWKRFHQLQNEYYFVLPAAATIDQRVTALGSVSGLELFSADNDSSPDDDFGTLPSTLIIKPIGLTNVIMVEFDLMEKVTTGAPDTQGWRPLVSAIQPKTNKAMDRGALTQLNDILDASRDVLVRVRFIKPVMP